MIKKEKMYDWHAALFFKSNDEICSVKNQDFPPNPDFIES